jgi:hypothetical protein
MCTTAIGLNALVKFEPRVYEVGPTAVRNNLASNIQELVAFQLLYRHLTSSYSKVMKAQFNLIVIPWARLFKRYFVTNLALVYLGVKSFS